MAGKIPQVGFADQPGAITSGGEQLDEGDMIARQRNAFVPHGIERRYPAGHQGGAIGHAHRIGDVKPVEAGPARGQPVYMRRAQNRIAIASQMIGPVLIGDDKTKLGRLVITSACVDCLCLLKRSFNHTQAAASFNQRFFLWI